jgi:glutathione synthase/RimK-type ligase-like ATP-grasp enzyme
MAWSGDAFLYGDLNLDDVQGVLLRGLPPQLPGPGVFNGAGGELDFATWFQHSCVQRDRHDAALGLILALEDSGVPIFNPPSRSQLSRRKPYQLSVMRRLGVEMPATLVTNDPARARAFVDDQRARGNATIVKPASGGALTMTGEELDDDAYEYLRMAPAIFQERVFGRDLRVMVLDGEVISCAAIKVPDGTLDFRGNATYQAGRIAYDDVELPAAAQDQARQLASALGLRFTGIDIKHTDDDRYVLLEANSSPIYLDVERKLGHPITDLLVQRVLDGPS